MKDKIIQIMKSEGLNPINVKNVSESGEKTKHLLFMFDTEQIETLEYENILSEKLKNIEIKIKSILPKSMFNIDDINDGIIEIMYKN